MISHRLGSDRRADRILVMDDGWLIEDGGQDELMAAGGPYARMFAAQAAWYQPSVNREAPAMRGDPGRQGPAPG